MEKTKAMKLTKDNIEKLVSTNDHGQEDITGEIICYIPSLQ